jgi:hypothetical protein
MNALYQADLQLWSQRQARLLREQHFDELDVTNLIRQLHDAQNQQRKTLQRKAQKLLHYFLKSQLYPERVSGKWLGALHRQRSRIHAMVREMPGIVPLLDDYLCVAYQTGAARLSARADLPRLAFAAELPWTTQQLLTADFMPWTSANLAKSEKAADT